MVENRLFDVYDNYFYFKVVLEMPIIEEKLFCTIQEVNKILSINKKFM